MITATISSLISIIVLALVIKFFIFTPSPALDGVIAGLTLSLGFSGTALATTFAFEDKKTRFILLISVTK